jgi:membrane associated rhomboid family serine protease
LLLSTFFNGSIMNVIFIMMSFAGMGPRLEQAHGTTAFLIMLLSLSVVANCLYLAVCVTLAYNPIKVLEYRVTGPAAAHSHNTLGEG